MYYCRCLFSNSRCNSVLMIERSLKRVSLTDPLAAFRLQSRENIVCVCVCARGDLSFFDSYSYGLCPSMQLVRSIMDASLHLKHYVNGARLTISDFFGIVAARGTSKPPANRTASSRATCWQLICEHRGWVCVQIGCVLQKC